MRMASFRIDEGWVAPSFMRNAPKLDKDEMPHTMTSDEVDLFHPLCDPSCVPPLPILSA